jgi:hypothetical protein
VWAGNVRKLPPPATAFKAPAMKAAASSSAQIEKSCAFIAAL